MKNRQQFIRWIPAISIMAIIFILSSIPSREMPSFGFWDSLVKKSGHFIGYGLLALALWFAVKWNGKKVWLVLLITFLYSISDEFHQSFIPGRHASLLDILLFDTAGAVTFVFCVGWLIKKKTGI
jgi:VanZ family protein